MTHGSAFRRTFPSFLLAGTIAAAAAAQDQPKTERVTTGPEYSAGGFHRAMLGSSYRDLWTTPVVLPVLDLSKEGGGGLKPVRRVGGQQTKGLALVGQDGRAYTFRGVEKDLSDALDDLILGRGVARGRHDLRHKGRAVREEFLERLRANGFREMTVREAPIEAGERIPGFHLDGDAVDFADTASEYAEKAVDLSKKAHEGAGR